MTRKVIPLAFVLTLVAAACAEQPHPEVRFGSGARFVPFVADPLNDAGRHPAVVANDEGVPVAAYFGFEEDVEEGEFPQARPVLAPTLPGVLMTTASPDGIWTRGAMAIQAQIPNVNVPFTPAVEESVADLGPNNATGLRMVADGDTFHAVWGSGDGVFYATGSLAPDADAQVSVERVANTPPVGPSIALVGGDPWVSYLSSTSADAGVVVAGRSGGGWQIERVGDAAGCDTCATAMIEAGGGPAVVYTDGGEGVTMAVSDGVGGWTPRQVSGTGGQGLSAAGGDDLVVLYYDGGQVVAATGGASGSFETAPVADVDEGSSTAEGAGTSVAVDDQGTVWAAWADAAGEIGLAWSAGNAQFEAIDTGGNTTGGQMPSVAVTPDGSTAYLAWYDAVHQDLLVGGYGELEGLALAAPSPRPEGPAVPPADGGRECTEPENGVVTITARGVQFDTSCVRVPPNEPVQIEFVNEDDGVPHNVAIYPSADEISADAAFLQGEVFDGVDSRTYDVPAMDEGEYYFHCDVHPNMSGVWVVGEADGATGATGATGGTGATGATGGAGGGGGAALTVVAQNIAFDTSTIELPADTPTTITFDNRDAGVPHDIAIYTDDTLAEELFNGDDVTGPATVDYEIPALPTGEYYFLCTIHPNMNGTVVVG